MLFQGLSVVANRLRFADALQVKSEFVISLAWTNMTCLKQTTLFLKLKAMIFFPLVASQLAQCALVSGLLGRIDIVLVRRPRGGEEPNSGTTQSNIHLVR